MIEVKPSAAQSILALNGTGPLGGLSSDWAGGSSVLLPQKWQERHAGLSREITSELEVCSASVLWRELISFSLDKLDQLEDSQMVGGFWTNKPCDLKTRENRRKHKRSNNPFMFILRQKLKKSGLGMQIVISYN